MAYLFQNKSSVLINERDFGIFMLDGIKISLHSSSPGRLIIYRKEEGSILTDIRPVGQMCLCDRDPNILRLQQKQMVIKKIILTYLNLLQETVTSLEVKLEQNTADCISSILKHQKCDLLRTKRSSLFNYIFGADAHDKLRVLSHTVSRNFRELNSFASQETSQLSWLNQKIMAEDLKIHDIFDFLVSSQVEIHMDTVTTQLNCLLGESLELVESQLLNQVTINILKLLWRQHNDSVYLKISNSCSRVSSFIPRLDGVLAINLFHQKVNKKDFLRFSCSPMFNASGVFINSLHHTSREKQNFRNNVMRRVESGDYIYDKVPVIVAPLNGSCFRIHCIQNVSYSEHGKLDFCTEKQVLTRCNEFELDFKYGTFSRAFHF